MPEPFLPVKFLNVYHNYKDNISLIIA